MITDIGVQHIGDRTRHLDVDLVTDLQVVQVLGLVGELDHHRFAVGIFDGHLAIGRVDGQYFGDDLTFKGFASQRDFGGLGQGYD